MAFACCVNVYGECAHGQHVRRTLTLTHTITAYWVSGNVVRVRILICATRQTPCRKSLPDRAPQELSDYLTTPLWLWQCSIFINESVKCQQQQLSHLVRKSRCLVQCRFSGSLALNHTQHGGARTSGRRCHGPRYQLRRPSSLVEPSGLGNELAYASQWRGRRGIWNRCRRRWTFASFRLCGQ